jgi:cobalt/nickel transport system permease protein
MFLYRYISVLGEETTRTLRAYSLRTVEENGIRYGVWGSLAGRLLLRTLDRAARIYQAMRCRGFNGELRTTGERPFKGMDLIFILGWTAFFIIVRLYNLPELLGSIVTGVH